MSMHPPLKHSALALGIVGVFAVIGLGVIAPGPFGTNFHTVVDGRVYRSGQLTAAELEEYAQRFALASVVNLQGRAPGADWYEAELAVARRLGLRHHDLDLAVRRLPTRPNVARLIELIETLPRPVLLHCGAGADRAGLASAVARIVLAEATLDEARSEMTFVYGHLPFGPQLELGRFFTLYETYLTRTGERDTPAIFKRWATQTYVPYAYSARIEVLRLPARAQPREPLRARIRVTNASAESWRLSRSKAEGVKLGVRLRRVGEETWREYDRAGYLTGLVEPGGTLEIEPPLFAPAVPGRYELKLDLVDENVTWFEDQGSTPVIVPLEVVASVLPAAARR